MRRVLRETYRDDFLTIESGKTLTFIVKEFLNDLACKPGPLTGLEKREGSANLTARL